MKVFISYRDDHHATAESLAEALSARGLSVRYLNGTSPTGYAGQRELSEQLEDHDTIVFILDDSPTWRQRTALSEAIQRRSRGDDIRLVSVMTCAIDLPGILQRYTAIPVTDAGWEEAVADAVTADTVTETETWTPERLHTYHESLETIVRQVADDVAAV